MKKALIKISTKKELYYYKDSIKIVIDKNDKSTIPSYIRGDVSNIHGDVSGIRGDVSGIRGNVSCIHGNVSGIRGNVNDCEITQEEREKGIDIKDLLA